MRALFYASAAISAVLGLSAQCDEFIFGACTHRESVPDYLNVLSQSGVDYVRDHATWNRCEDEKGKPFLPAYYVEYVDKAKSFNLDTLNILCYSNKLYDEGGYPRSPEAIEAYVKYAETIVGGLKGKSRLYQVWNEWDGGCGMPKELHGTGDPESYMKVLKAAYPRIKTVDGDAIVISNSVCTGDAYLKDLIKFDLLKNCDAVGLHTYNYSRERSAERWYERMQGVDSFLREANGGKSFPVYITEMGWPTHADSKRGSSEEYSADCMAKLYLLGLTMPFIKGIWWYEFRDGGMDYKYNEDNFGMVRPDLTPKKSFFVMRDLCSLFKRAAFSERIDVKDSEIWVLKYKAEDGSPLIAAWTQKDDTDVIINLSVPSSVSTDCRLTELGYGSVNRKFFKTNEKSERAKFQMTVRSRPYVLSGTLEGIKIDSVKAVPFPLSELVPRKIVFNAPDATAKAFSHNSGKVPAVYSMGESSKYRTLIDGSSWAGHSDLDASFSVSWSKEALYFDVEVLDDRFLQSFGSSETWKGDSLQMAFSYFGDGVQYENTMKHIDIDVALTKNGAGVYRQCVVGKVREGVADDIKALIVRNGTRTAYKLEIPVKSVELPELKAGMTIGFSMLVNDNDGNGRKGYLHWGAGIGDSKDPLRYNRIALED